eukprot:scaffold1221_cov207-Amphora_coffeaeformis.AAC.26
MITGYMDPPPRRNGHGHYHLPEKMNVSAAGHGTDLAGEEREHLSVNTRPCVLPSITETASSYPLREDKSVDNLQSSPEPK